MTYTNLHPFIKRLIWAVVVLVVVLAFAVITRFALLLVLAPAFAGWVLFPPSDEAIERTEEGLDEYVSHNTNTSVTGCPTDYEIYYGHSELFNDEN